MSIQRFFLLQKIKQKLKYKAAKMASSQNALLTFFTGLREFHVYRSCWKPYLKQKIEFRREKTINTTNMLMLATLIFLRKWSYVLLVICLGK